MLPKSRTLTKKFFVIKFQARREINLDVRGKLLPHLLQAERGLPRWQEDHQHHLKDQKNRRATARV